jgi:hypothetical protein
LKCHTKFFKEKECPIEARYIDNQNCNAAPSTSVGAPSLNYTNRDNRRLAMSSNWLSVVMNTSSPPPLPPLQQEADPMEGVEKGSDECHLSTSSQLSNPQYLQHTPCTLSQTNSSNSPQGPSSSIAVSRTERPYKCEICGKGFRTVGNRKTHQKVVCQGILDYQCTFCKRKFGQKTNMESHVKTMHPQPGSQDYQCSFCDQKYSLQAGVKRHMKAKHKEKLANELPSAIE